MYVQKLLGAGARNCPLKCTTVLSTSHSGYIVQVVCSIARFSYSRCVAPLASLTPVTWAWCCTGVVRTLHNVLLSRCQCTIELWCSNWGEPERVKTVAGRCCLFGYVCTSMQEYLIPYTCDSLFMVSESMTINISSPYFLLNNWYWKNGTREWNGKVLF